ncbi:MAG: hypothetical protein P8129_13545 [Anaerolineae bacterium]|jgi:hypothetical protein
MSPGGATVEVHSGHDYAGEPRAVISRGRRYEVEAVIAEWRLPEGPCYRVMVEGGGIYDVEYDEAEDRWSISYYRISGVGPSDPRDTEE